MTGRYERSDMNPRYVLYFGAALIVAVAVISVGLWWMFQKLEEQQARREKQPVSAGQPPPVPAPRLQIDPQAELQEMLRSQNEILSTYGWVDRAGGVARIPIDRAMELFLERQGK